MPQAHRLGMRALNTTDADADGHSCATTPRLQLTWHTILQLMSRRFKHSSQGLHPYRRFGKHAAHETALGRLPQASTGQGASRLPTVWHHKWPRPPPRHLRQSMPPSWRPPPRRQGMVTHDKCCLIRHCQVQLRWSRQPYRSRPRTSDDLLDETSHREGSHETLLADTAAIPAHGGRGTAMGSGVPTLAAMDNTDRAVRRARPISHTTSGGDA
jgi:hypothetical protein